MALNSLCGHGRAPLSSSGGHGFLAWTGARERLTHGSLLTRQYLLGGSRWSSAAGRVQVIKIAAESCPVVAPIASHRAATAARFQRLSACEPDSKNTACRLLSRLPLRYRFALRSGSAATRRRLPCRLREATRLYHSLDPAPFYVGSLDKVPCSERTRDGRLALCRSWPSCFGAASPHVGAWMGCSAVGAGDKWRNAAVGMMRPLPGLALSH